MSPKFTPATRSVTAFDKPAAVDDASSGDATLLDLAALVVGGWRTIAVVALGLTALALGVSLVLPSKYTSSTTFTPEVSANQQVPAAFAGLAGQLGLSLGAAAGASPRFYADVLESRELLEGILLRRFPVPDASPGDSAPLLTLIDIDAENHLDSLQEGTEELSKMIGTRVDAETSIITVRVETRHRELSAAIANALIRDLNEFNTVSRQSKAKQRRTFVESRLEATTTDLENAELALKEFYESNLTWQDAPRLAYREGQLRRRVEVVQDLFITLSREYETARIEELNDTPAITVIDAAVPVHERSFPRYGLIAVMALVVGGGIGTLLVLLSAYVERLRVADPEAYRRMQALLPIRRRQ